MLYGLTSRSGVRARYVATPWRPAVELSIFTLLPVRQVVADPIPDESVGASEQGGGIWPVVVTAGYAEL